VGEISPHPKKKYTMLLKLVLASANPSPPTHPPKLLNFVALQKTEEALEKFDTSLVTLSTNFLQEHTHTHTHTHKCLSLHKPKTYKSLARTHTHANVSLCIIQRHISLLQEHTHTHTHTHLFLQEYRGHTQKSKKRKMKTWCNSVSNNLSARTPPKK